jgi:VWFA-related protein
MRPIVSESHYRRATYRLTLFLAFIVATTPRAQVRPAQPGFRTGTELIRVDFTVTDKTGRPMPGLTAKEVSVREDGKEQAIVTFDAFASGDAASATAAVRAGTADASSTTPVAAVPDASTVLLVDDTHLTAEQAARLRPALKGLLTTVGRRSGSLMLVSPASKISLLAVLPTGAASLLPAVERIAGTRVEERTNFPVADAEGLAILKRDNPTIARVAARFVTLNPELSKDQAETIAIERGVQVAHDAVVRRDTMYDGAMVCLDWLGGRPGRHSLIVVSAGFPTDETDSKYYDVVTRSLRVNAPIHFLDARGLSGFNRYHDVEFSPLLSRNADDGPFGRWQAAEGTMGLAIDTGGLIVDNTNNMEKGLDQLLDTMTAYYVLAYQAPLHDKAGFHKIKVDVRGKGITVRARRGYYAQAAAK